MATSSQPSSITPTIDAVLSVVNARAAASAARYTTSSANRNPRRPGTRAYLLLVGVLFGLRLGLGLCFLGLRLRLRRRGLDQRRRGAAGLRNRRVRRVEERLRDLRELVAAETGGGQQLLGAFLRALQRGSGLRARPVEGLVDLGAHRVRELGGLVPRLLEQPGAARLGLAHLRGGVAVRVREQLARLVLRVLQQLVALALAVLAEALDASLFFLQLALAAGDLRFRALE